MSNRSLTLATVGLVTFFKSVSKSFKS